MSEPSPVNISRTEVRDTQRSARRAAAKQTDAEETLQEEMQTRFNPDAVDREKSRRERFNSLERRAKTKDVEKEKVEEVEKSDDLAKQYNKRNPELDAARLRYLRDSLRETETAEEVLDDVNAYFEDPSLIDPSLSDEILEYLEKETGGDLRSQITKARTILNENKGREIIAGRNIDGAAKNYFKKGIGRSPTELRNLYRDITGNPRDHNTLFSELSSKYSFDQLKLIVAFLLKGMSYDLKSKGPSIQQAELILLMTDIRNLQSILWVYLFFKSRMKLIRKMYSKLGLSFSDALTFEKLAKAFIKLVEERYPSVLKLLKEAEELGLIDDFEKIIVLSQYRDAMRQLSLRLFKTMKRRQDLLSVLLESLEELEERVEEEDEMEG